MTLPASKPDTPADLKPGALGFGRFPVMTAGLNGTPQEWFDAWVVFVGWLHGYPWVRFVSPPPGRDDKPFVYSCVDYGPIAPPEE